MCDCSTAQHVRVSVSTVCYPLIHILWEGILHGLFLVFWPMCFGHGKIVHSAGRSLSAKQWIVLWPLLLYLLFRFTNCSNINHIYFLVSLHISLFLISLLKWCAHFPLASFESQEEKLKFVFMQSYEHVYCLRHLLAFKVSGLMPSMFGWWQCNSSPTQRNLYTNLYAIR
jgi:hypothetical protein